MVESYRPTYFEMAWQWISHVGFSDVKRWCTLRVPMLTWAPSYNTKEYLLSDTVAGMMLTVQQVAQGLAFAVMSSVHPVFGLYSSVFPALIYVIFGTGRHVSTGSFAITSLISAGAVERLVSSSSHNVTNGSQNSLGLSDFEMQRIGVAAAVTFLGGIIQLSMSFLHLGSATILLSEPVVSSMTTGAATHVVTSQVKYLLGIKMPYISGPLGMFYIYNYILMNIRMVQIKVCLFSLLSIIILLLAKKGNEKCKSKIRMVLPIDLLLIITASFVCYVADMENVYGIAVVGPIPKGIPFPQIPPMHILSDVVVEAFSFALVGYTVSIFLAYNSAKKFKYAVDENQELLAHGLTNIIPSFLFCIPNAAAPARTFLLYNNGAKTQVACLISCIMVLLVIFFVVPFLYWLPMCVLASIIVVGLKGMLIQFRDLRKYWNVDKNDWILWVCTYLVTICFAANIGLLFGVVFNLVISMLRLARGNTLHVLQLDEDCETVLENINMDLYQKVRTVSVGMPLFFLNAKKFHSEIMKINSKLLSRNDLYKSKSKSLLSPLTNGAYTGKLISIKPLRDESSAIILDCSGITFFDSTGVATLGQVCLELHNHGTEVLLASCNVSLVKALQYNASEIKHPLLFESVKSARISLQFKRSHPTNLETMASSDV
ncbi:anion exchange transporter [Pelodytes ibericus]